MKKVLYVVIGLLVLYIILAFVGPKEIIVQRKIAINRPVSVVKKKLGDFQYFHDTWSPWTERDLNMTYSYGGTPGEIGHHYAWSGNDRVGKGEMTLTGYNGDTLLQRLSLGGRGEAKSYFIMEDNNPSTNLTWGMRFNVGFFQRPPMLFVNMDKMLGEDYEKGLIVLKMRLEDEQTAEQPAVKYTINELEWPDVTYVGKKETVLFQNLNGFFSTNFPALSQDLEKNKIEAKSMPTAIFTSYDEKNAKADVVAAIKVEEGKKLKGWDTFKYKKSKVLHVAYYGSYEKSALAHAQIGDYMKAHNMKQGDVLEEYMTSPMQEKDTAKWLTNIYYFVK